MRSRAVWPSPGLLAGGLPHYSMRFKIKCVVCGATQWARGWEEFDTNAAGIDDSEPLDECCDHVLAGGTYEIVDQEFYDSGADDYC
jgi:hypothetical protein